MVHRAVRQFMQFMYKGLNLPLCIMTNDTIYYYYYYWLCEYESGTSDSLIISVKDLLLRE